MQGITTMYNFTSLYLHIATIINIWSHVLKIITLDTYISPIVAPVKTIGIPVIESVSATLNMHTAKILLVKYNGFTYMGLTKIVFCYFYVKLCTSLDYRRRRSWDWYFNKFESPFTILLHAKYNCICHYFLFWFLHCRL